MRNAWLLLLGAVAALTGCKYNIVECNEDQQALITDAQVWVIENADAIDATMKANWSRDREAAMDEIVEAILGANVQCGVGNKESDSIPASDFNLGDRIVIDVGSEYFTYTLNLYMEHSWTQETLTELEGSTAPGDVDEYEVALANALPYETSLGAIGSLLTHEAAHEVLGRDHTDEAKERHDRIKERVGEDNVHAGSYKHVDEIYALGWWTLETSQLLWEEQRDEYYATYAD
ncbi:MAG: hypothetical protein AAB776_01775 [Patescibacteria group bacterium]